MRKNIFILILCGLLGGHVQAADGETFTINTSEGVAMTFRVISETEKTAKVGIGNGSSAISQSTSGTVTIPNVVTYNEETYSVTAIELNAFYRCQGITSVHIPNSITIIGKSAFENCIGLTSINIPSNIKTIDENAFKDCSNLASVTLNEGLETISKGAFYKCTSLTSIAIPNSLTNLGSLNDFASYGIFGYCTKLQSVTFGGGMTYIPWGAFEYCSALESITIPSNVTIIKGNAFSGCTSLTGDIVLAEGATYIGSGAFTRTKITSIKLPSTITSFAYNALTLNTDIKKVIVPSLEQWCSLINFSESYSIGGGYNATGLLHYANLYIAGHEDSPIRDVVIPNGVKRISKNAFWNASITSVEIPSSVDSVYFEAFEFCENLKNIKFHEGLKYIDNGAFHSCNSLETLNLPNGLIELGEAFYQCTGLKYVEIPNSVTTLNTTNRGIFNGCSNLESVKFGSGMTEIPHLMFVNCTSLQFVEIPSNITKMGMSAFGNCKHLKKIIIPNSVEIIDKECFEGCEELAQVIVPDFNITNWCGKYLEGNPMKYTHHLYDTEGNDLIVDVVIPEGVNQMGMSVFSGCESMTSLTLPSTLKEIKSSAFASCCNLKSVTCKMKEPNGNINAFQYFAGISPECVLYVPMGTKDTYIAKGWNEIIFKGGIVEYDPTIPGDANGDGGVNVFDVTTTVNHILGSGKDGFDEKAADVNGDGTVNVFDVTKIVNILLGVDAGAKKREE